MNLTASELWKSILSISATLMVLTGLIIAIRVRQTLARLELKHEQFVSWAKIDGLTGLLNRSGFDALASEAFAETRRLGHPISLLLCDIDAFRVLNERYGPQAGDRALNKLAEVLDEVTGHHSAIIGRQAADEFAILLLGTDPKAAVAIAKTLCEACEARGLVQQDVAAKFTISVGLVTEVLGASELGELFRQTNAALYRAKRAGGNRVASGPGRVQRFSAPTAERFPTPSAKSFMSLQQRLLHDVDT